MHKQRQSYRLGAGVCALAGLVVAVLLTLGATSVEGTDIYTESDLESMSSSGTHTQMNDIVLNPATWDPHTAAFTGTFDGNGFTISGLNESTGGQPRGGIFNDLRGTVKNLTLTGSFSGQWRIGGLAGDGIGATVSNCTFDIAVSSSGERAGIVIGNSSSSAKLIDVTASGSVSCSGAGEIGGLIGYMSGGSITECRSSAIVIGTASACDNVGGLVGYQTGGTIQRSYCTGAVSGQNEYNGGLVGYLTGSGIIKDSYSTANVTNSVSSAYWTGGLVGRSISGTTITNCYASGDVYCVGHANAGGLVGDNYATLNNSFSVGDISYQWDNYLGGSIAYNRLAVGNVWWTNNVAVGAEGTTTGITKGSGYSQFHSSANAPLSSWDFATVWVEVPGDYPQLQAFAGAAAPPEGMKVLVR